MSQSLANQSEIRLRRAKAARALLQLHQQGQLELTEQWTWQQMDSLPDWWLQSAQERQSLQLCCGALLLAPQTRLWIDRRYIQAAFGVVGEHVFDQTIVISEQLAFSSNGHQMPDDSVNPNNPALLQQQVQTSFKRAGASVLACHLSEDLPASAMTVVNNLLGHSAKPIDAQLGHTLFQTAMHIISESLNKNAAMVGLHTGEATT